MYFFQHDPLIVRPKTSLTSLNVMFSDIHLATLVFHIVTFTCFDSFTAEASSLWKTISKRG